MIVVDASAMVEALVGRTPDPALLEALDGDVAAPHLLDVEVMSVLRGLTLSGKLGEARAEEARRDYFSLVIARRELLPLAERVWQLRHRFTACDASYLALAQALDAPLMTCDRKLAAARPGVEVRVLPGAS